MDDTSPLVVACLCAEWCGSCRDYRAAFARVSADFAAGCRFVWIDIEDEADIAGNIDVDNFPTLLIARAGAPLFFGAVTPHLQTLQRLIATALAGELKLGEPGGDDLEVAALARRLTA